MIEIEPPQENGEQENGKQDKLLTTTFQFEIENRKLKGSLPIQLINKYSNSRLILGELILNLHYMN